MSGINVGSRLEQLLTLRNKLDHEIAIEKRKARLEGVGVRARATKPPRVAINVRLAELGVTSTHVKHWAKDFGLIPEVTRGRVSWRLVDAYAAAHSRGGLVGRSETHGAL